MTKEELEKEATEWVRQKFSMLDLRQSDMSKIHEYEAYIAGAEPRDKRIAELKENLNNLASVAEERLANWQKYEKAYNEAEELLDKQIEVTYKLFEENKEAKEIIKELLFTSNELDENTRSKAEQFLKEVKE